MPVTRFRAPTVTAVAFTNTANMVDAGSGTFGTWTSNSRNAAVTETFSAFDFSAIPGGSTINSVTLIVRHYVSAGNVSDLSSISIGGVASSITATAAESSVSGGTTLPTTVDLYYKRGNNTRSTTVSVDYLDVEVDYTEPAPTTYYQTLTAVSTISAGGASGAVNLLTENQADGCEDGTTTGWQSHTAGTTFSSSTDFAKSGSRSLKSVQLSTGRISYSTSPTVIPVTVGNQYTAVASMRAGAGNAAVDNEQISVGLYWFTAADAANGYTFSTATTINESGWTDMVSTGTAPANSAYVRVIVYSNALRSATSTYYIDEVGVWEGASTSWVLPSASVGSLLKTISKALTGAVSSAASLLPVNLGGGGTTYYETLSATASASAAMIKAGAKTLSDSMTTSGALTRAAAKTLSDTVNTTATVRRDAAKTLTDTVTAAASMTRSAIKFIEVAGTAVVSGALSRAVGKTVSDTVATSASIVRDTAKTLTDTVTATATLAAIKARFLDLVASVSTTATVARDVSKTLADAVTTTASATRTTAKTLVDTVTASAVVSTIKAKLLALSATVTTTATARRDASITRTASVSIAGSARRAVSKTLADSVVVSASIVAGRALLRTLSATVTTTADVRKAASVTMSALATSAGSVTKSVAKTVSASASTVADLVSAMSGTLRPGLGRLLSYLVPRSRTTTAPGSAARVYTATTDRNRTTAPDSPDGRHTAAPGPDSRPTDPLKEN